MKPYLFLLLFSLSSHLFAQVGVDATQTTTFSTAELTFNSEGATLAGIVYKPKNAHAAVVIVHGSGQEKRSDELAAKLANNGIAVFTYDKRGVGKSGGVYVGPEVGSNNIDLVNLNLLASDVSAAVSTLYAQLNNKKKMAIGLLGGSQAGWIIPMAASKTKKVNFMVIFSGPVVTTLQQLRFQFYTNGNNQFWDTHTEADALLHIHTDADRYQFAATDPQDFLKQLSIPGIWLFGAKDIQVPVALSISNLNTLQAKGKKISYQVFPELGHNTLFAKAQEPLIAAIAWIRKLPSSN